MIGIKKSQMLKTLLTLKSANKLFQKQQIQKYNDAVELLSQCQNIALEIGKNIELHGGDAENLLIPLLEEYCELLYQLSTSPFEKSKRIYLTGKIQELLIQLENGISNNIPKDKKEIVFFPYKASMWDSLESIWKAASMDETCDVYVVPIPYFDRNPDGSLGEMHYEGHDYPKDVPITSWEEYHLEERTPDVIYIHNPYDNCNRITSVHPYFYSQNLKKHTNNLVYVPYFIFPFEFDANFAAAPGIFHCDLMFVQNETIRNGYITALTKIFPNINKDDWEKKIKAIGSPKTDKIINMKREDYELPESWKEALDGKKIIFFNTNVSMVLHNPSHVLENLKRIFETIHNCENYQVIWREHPLTIATIKSMVPTLLEPYQQLRQEFLEKHIGILDDTPEPYMAMVVSDCYYGAGGSLSCVYPVTGKPVLITDYKYPEQISQEIISLEDFKATASLRMLFAERNINSLSVFLQNLSVFEEQKEERIEKQKIRMDNLDGLVGVRIHNYVTKEE